MTFTKEQLIEHVKRRIAFARCGCRFSDSDRELDAAVLEIALASLEAEPVAWTSEEALAEVYCGETGMIGPQYMVGNVSLYRHAQQAPVVPDEYRHLSELYHAQEKRLFKLAQRIKGPSFDKYAHSPSQAIDVLEAVIFGEDDDSCRAVILQSFGNSEKLDEVGSWNNHRNTPTAKPAIDTGELLKSIEGMEVSVDVSTCDADAGHRYFGTITEISELDTAKNGYILLVQDAKPNFNHTEQHLDMVGRSGDASEKSKDVTLINEGNIPATQIKPVADLYGITSPTGSETTFTFDAGEASSFVGSGWSVQEYVELERYQQSVTGNSPETPDGWVMVPKEITCAMDDAAWEAYHETRCMSDIWAALLAAAPQKK